MHTFNHATKSIIIMPIVTSRQDITNLNNKIKKYTKYLSFNKI